jgi:hypothetical protein
MLFARVSLARGDIPRSTPDHAGELEQRTASFPVKTGFQRLTDHPAHGKPRAAGLLPEPFQKFLGQAYRECVTHMKVL